MFILQRFNWLKDFGSCFNFVLELDGVQYTPKVAHQRIETLVPYVNYRKLQTSLPYKFQRWTTCQTLSIVLNFDYVDMKNVSDELGVAFVHLGFYGANWCLPFGHLCSVAQHDLETPLKPSSIHQRPLGMYPLQILFVLPDSAVSSKFSELTFYHTFKNNPFFQTHFRITFPVHEILEVGNNGLDAILAEESNCTEVTLMCKYCNINTTDKAFIYKEYPFTDITSVCDSGDLQNIMSSLHFNATGNGKKLLYYNLEVLEFSYTSKIEIPDTQALRAIQNAKSMFEIWSRKPSIDQIIASILLEGLNVIGNFTARPTEDRSILAIGSDPRLKLSFGILKLSSNSFNFITCDEMNSIDLLVLLRSFKLAVWLFLFTSIVLTLLFMRVGINIISTFFETNKNNTFCPCSIILCITALLLNTIVDTKEISAKKNLRGFLTSWLIATIVISNAYKGDIYAKTTAPTKTFRLETFHQLSGFQLFSKQNCEQKYFKNSYNFFACTEFGYRVCTFLFHNLGYKNYLHFLTITSNWSSSFRDFKVLETIEFTSKKDEEITHLLFQTNHAPPQINTSIVHDLIGKCSKTAYIGKQMEIKKMVHAFHKEGKTFIYSGKARFLEMSSVWYAQESGGYYMKKRMNHLEESGIYNFWSGWVDKLLDEDGIGDGVQYVPKNHYQRIDTLVPYVNYWKINNTVLYRFHRWTTCQTLSVVMNLNIYTNMSEVSQKLKAAFLKLGFHDAYYCLPFGHLCSVALKDHETWRKPTFIYQRPLGMYPLQIFFVLPDTPASNQFTLLTFIREFEPNPFHQKLFLIIFPVQEKIEVSNNFVDAILVEESMCTEITFLCMYCNTSMNIYTQTQDPFTDMKSTCDSADLQNILLNLYFNATGNGKKLTYFRYLAIIDLQTQIDTANVTILREIQNAKSIFDILNKRHKPSIDHVITSILFDGLNMIDNVSRSLYGDRRALAIGTDENLNISLGTLKMSSKSFNFITCDSKKSIDLLVILRSFQAIVWFLLVLVILLTPLIMHVSINLNCGRNKVTITDTISSSSVVLGIIALLLGTVVYTKEFNQNCKLRGVFVTWLLTSIVISNAYKGDNFAKTTAPTQISKAENFQQLAGFRLFSTLYCEKNLLRYSLYYYLCTDFGAGISTALLSSIGVETFYHLLKAAANRSNSNSSSEFNFLKAMNFSLKQDYDNAHLMFHTHPAPQNINTSIALSLIGKCDKTAYVGRQPEIHRLVNDFKEENNTFIYAGKARFLEIPSVWHAQESGGYFMKNRMSYLGESGIYDFWKGWIERGWERTGGGSTKIRKISLASNIVVIFFVTLWANVIASLAFIIELLIFRGCNSKPKVDCIKAPNLRNMLYKAILSIVYSIFVMVISISQIINGQRMFILQRFNWLKDFSSCFNFVLALDGVQYAPKVPYQRIDTLVPYVNYRKLQTSLPYKFQRWTTCQTLSIVLNFDYYVDMKNVSDELGVAFVHLGFYGANWCLPFGHFCSVVQKEYEIFIKPSSINLRPLGMYPLQILFILPDLIVNSKFTELTFDDKFKNNPFFQTHFRLKFPVHEILEVRNNGLDAILTEKSTCTEITLMCKYCNINSTDKSFIYSKYPFTDITSVCNSGDLQNIMSSLHFNATGNGKKLLYYNLAVLEFGHTSKIEILDVQALRAIQNAKSVFEIWSRKPSIDQIITSILLERLTNNFTVSTSQDRRNLAFGSDPNLNRSFGILKMASKSFNFITCDKKKSIDLLVLLRSFKIDVWIFLLICILFMLYLIHVSIHVSRWFQKSLESDNVRSCSIVLYLTAILLSTVVNTKELSTKKKLRAFFVAWLLTSVVISNAYKGDIFAKATAPTKTFQLETFQQLSGFKLFSKLICGLELSKVRYNFFMCTEFGYRVTRYLARSLSPESYLKLILFRSKNSSSSLSNFKFLKTINFTTKQVEENAYLLLQTHHAPPQINTSIVHDLIGKCSKTAYIGKQMEINKMVHAFHKEGKTFMYSEKARFLEMSSVWYAQESGGYFMKERMSYLGESGIYDFWIEWIDKFLVKVATESESIKLRKISLTSNIIVIFFVMLAAYTVTSIMFLTEFLMFRNSSTTSSEQSRTRIC
ncbi:unnamed protein product [Orchesella dallaii]|uniref:Uncharacterized protein n=1 Tax=Orchesella dallaii TaxID=48710 RepID=A0ABP1RFW1_9HEXA